MIRIPFTVLVLSAITAAVQAGSNCPLAKKIEPCICSEAPQNSRNFTTVSCRGFRDNKSFLDIPTLLDGMIIDQLIISNNYIPPEQIQLPVGWVRGIRFHEIQLQNHKLSRYSPCKTDVFKGQEGVLRKFAMTNSPHVELISLYCLRQIKNLTEIDLSRNSITIVEASFPPLQKLEKLDLSHNKIQGIQEGAFSSLRSLRFINLSHNIITTIPTGLFSSRIYIMDFSYNRIESVPQDLFANITINSTALFAHNFEGAFPLNKTTH